uniref:Ig-like domain-containing protein n=1 Tax=Knipowitschia caucasica TaxID=637954 RepID=A0AAV2MFY5_KNICA
MILPPALTSCPQKRSVVEIDSLASLRCGGGAKTNCSETKWTFNSQTDVFYSGSRDLPGTYKQPLVLVQSGTVSPGPKAGRLNLTESCDLLIQRVRSDDAGVYTCSRINHSSLSNRSVVFLSVVYWNFAGSGSRYGNEESTQSCSVTPFSIRCGFSVKWLVQGSGDFNLWTDSCGTGIQFFGASPGVLQCEVTDLNSKQVYYFRWGSG